MTWIHSPGHVELKEYEISNRLAKKKKRAAIQDTLRMDKGIMRAAWHTLNMVEEIMLKNNACIKEM